METAIHNKLEKPGKFNSLAQRDSYRQGDGVNTSERGNETDLIMRHDEMANDVLVANLHKRKAYLNLTRDRSASQKETTVSTDASISAESHQICVKYHHDSVNDKTCIPL